MPPLRERREDIPLLAAFFLERFARRENKTFEAISAAALERLSAHDWPGNVRELENAIERGVVVGRGPLLEAADLPPQLRSGRRRPRGRSPIWRGATCRWRRSRRR